MIPAENFALTVENGSRRPAVLFKQRRVLTRLDDSQGKAPDVVEDAGGKRDFPVNKAMRSQALGHNGTSQIVAPEAEHGGKAHGFAEIGSNGNGDTEALKVRGAEDGDRLHNAAGREARGVEERIGDGKHFTGESGIGGDQVADLVKLDVLIGG